MFMKDVFKVQAGVEAKNNDFPRSNLFALFCIMMKLIVCNRNNLKREHIHIACYVDCGNLLVSHAVNSLLAMQ